MVWDTRLKRPFLSICIVLCILSVSLSVAVSASALTPSVANESALWANSTANESGITPCGEGEIYVYGRAGYKYGTIDEKANEELYHPLRQIPIEIVQVDASNGTNTVAETRTGGHGNFGLCLSLSNLEGESPEVLVRFIGQNPAGSVRDGVSLLNGSVYTATSNTTELNTSVDVVELGKDRSGDGQPEVIPKKNQTAFHLLDTALEAQQFLRNQTEDNLTRKKIRLLYPMGGTEYVPNDPVDSDEAIWFDNDDFSVSPTAIYHEYGHAVMVTTANYKYGNIPRGGRSIGFGCHSFITESNFAFALREGFAEYYSAVGRNDWDDEGTFYEAEYGVCDPFDADGTMDGYRVEGSVAAILWDVTDSGEGDDDGINESFDVVLDVFREHHPQSMWDVYQYLQDDVENETALDSIFTTHGIDVAEPAITVVRGRTQPVYTDEVVLKGSVRDEHSNVSRVQIRVNNDHWNTIASNAVSSWSTTVSTGSDTVDVEIRATDPWGNNATANVTLSPKAGPPIVGNRSEPVQDLDGDGRYEDINADGTADVFDALVYYNERRSPRIRANAALFDFDGDGSAGDLFDALALAADVQ